LEEFGGRPGVLNLDRIESGVARPYHGYHRSLAKKAAALLEGVGNGHGFVDGNKRTAVVLTQLLVQRSGYVLHLETEEALEDLVVAIASHQIDRD
jgi:death-on-curing protein